MTKRTLRRETGVVLGLAIATLAAGCAGPGASRDGSAPAIAAFEAAGHGPITEATRAAIEAATGLKGAFNDKENVFKVTQARTDVRVAVEGRALEPFMGLTSWAAFTPGGKAEAVVAGDLVLFEDELSPAMDALLGAGLSVTALHNHFVFERPRVFFMHIGGEGGFDALAKGVRAGLDAVKSVRSRAATVAEAFPGESAAAANQIPQSKIDGILGLGDAVKSQTKDGMYKVVIGREVAMACGCRIGKEMGVNTWFALCGDEKNASCSGDILTFAGELQPVLRALRKAGIHVVTIHNHMEGEDPRGIFLHFWGKGGAESLARGFKGALDAQAGRHAGLVGPPVEITLAGVDGRIDHMDLDPASGRLYIAALGNGSLEVVDTRRGERVKSVGGLKEPQGVVVAPRLGRVFVACGGDGTVRAFDTSTLAEIKSAAVGEDADNIRLDADGGELIVGCESGALVFLDPATLSEKGRAKLPSHPESFRVEPGTRRIHVNLPGGVVGGGGTVAVVDGASRSVVATWELSGAGRNFPMALDPSHRRLYVGCRRPARLLAIDTTSGRQVAAMDCVGDADDVFVTADGALVMVTGGDGKAEFMATDDFSRYTALPPVTTAAGARTALYAPESGTLFVAAPARDGRAARIIAFPINP